MRQFLRKLIRNETGVALIEFAIVFPFMFLLLFGTIELGRYVVILQRVEHAAYVLTDITGQYAPATATGAAGEINVTRLSTEVFPQFHRIMGVYGDTSREAVVISSVINRNGTRLLRWQRSINGGVPGFTSIVTGTAPQNTTRTGGVCQPAPFDATVNAQLGTMLNGENMIVGEVSYRYRPIVASLLPVTTATQNLPGSGGGPFSVPEQTITRRLYLHPRNGDLLDIPPAHPITAGACT